MDDLEATIRQHLPAALFDRRAADSKSYHEGFRASSRAKAKNALNTLKDLSVDLKTCVYVSIGGSYGAELVWLMENSDLSRGVLLEYDPNVFAEVSSESQRLATMGKELVPILGDATQQADSCRRTVEAWQQKGGVDSVVCSVHAVFHELPTRSPNFHLGNFLHKMLSGWPRSIFISREPCAPVDWPQRVELSVPQLPTEVLEQLAREIQRHLRFGGKIHRVGDAVELSNVLAVETLAKLFYAEDMQHELQERLTRIKPPEFTAELEKHLGPSSVSVRYASSNSFEANYRSLNVSARRPKGGKVLPIPSVFCEFVGDSRRSADVAQSARTVIVCETAPSSYANDAEVETTKPIGMTVRYLRRRCRVIVRGTKKFQSIIHSLLSRQYSREEAVTEFEASWETLKNPYEQVMTHAAYLESMGDIESMQKVLEKPRFTGAFESARMLYEALAREKLDDIQIAQRLLRTILDTERNRDLLRAAQFNMHVCYEKVANFEDVNFEAFFNDRDIIFIDGERLSDKAVAMHLIVCMELDRPFIHKRLLDESLGFLSEKCTAGYVKTLLTKIESGKSQLTQVTINTIMEHLQLMDANSRIAIMVRLCDYLPAEAETLRQSILERVRLEPHRSETVAKWKRAHQRTAEGHGKAS